MKINATMEKWQNNEKYDRCDPECRRLCEKCVIRGKR